MQIQIFSAKIRIYMKFSDILGQDLAKKILQGIIKNKRFAGTYLFSGPNGVGKYLAATAFAAAANCERGGIEACGECLSCKKIAHGSHPDIIRILPLKDKRYVSIDQLRELQKLVLYGPSTGQRLFAIIREIESPKTEAANSALKLFEEPPTGVSLIIVTDRAEAILPTIRSRAQHVIFNALSPALVKNYLKEHYSLKAEELENYYALSGGSLGRVKDIMELLPQVGWIKKGIAEVERRDYADWVPFIDEFDQQKEAAESLLNVFMFGLWRRVLAAGGERRWLRAMDAVLEAANSLRRHGNLRLTLDIMCIRIGANLRAPAGSKA